MVRVRNVGSGPVVVGEKYLYPGESRLVTDGQAAAVLGCGMVEVLGGIDVLAWDDNKALSVDTSTPSPSPAPEQAFWEGEEKPGAVRDNLRAIRGIGARVEEALTILGIGSYADLVGWDAGVLAAALDGSSQAQVERWQAQARTMIED